MVQGLAHGPLKAEIRVRVPVSLPNTSAARFPKAIFSSTQADRSLQPESRSRAPYSSKTPAFAECEYQGNASDPLYGSNLPISANGAPVSADTDSRGAVITSVLTMFCGLASNVRLIVQRLLTRSRADQPRLLRGKLSVR